MREFTQRCTDVLEMYVRRHPVAVAVDAPALARRAAAGRDAGHVPARRGQTTRRAEHDARLVVLAPNWLGDAVMALPAIAERAPVVRRRAPGRRGAPVGGAAVHDGRRASTRSITLPGRGGWRDAMAAWPTRERSRPAASTPRCCCPIRCMPRWLVRQRRRPERWGYRGRPARRCC